MSFTLAEHKSVPERAEARKADKPLTAASSSPAAGEGAIAPVEQAEKEMGWIYKLLKRRTTAIGDYEKTAKGSSHLPGSLPLVSEDVRLELSAPGRAVFQVATSEPVSGEVLFTMGYGVDDADTLFFAGFVERYLPVDDTQARLMCREMSARMDKAIPLALRTRPCATS